MLGKWSGPDLNECSFIALTWILKGIGNVEPLQF